MGRNTQQVSKVTSNCDIEETRTESFFQSDHGEYQAGSTRTPRFHGDIVSRTQVSMPKKWELIYHTRNARRRMHLLLQVITRSTGIDDYQRHQCFKPNLPPISRGNLVQQCVGPITHVDRLDLPAQQVRQISSRKLVGWIGW